MCILKINKCGRCETEYRDIYRCIGKLQYLQLPPCNTNSNKGSASNLFVCSVCLIEERGYESLDILLQHLKIECELKQKALTTTGSESCTVFM